MPTWIELCCGGCGEQTQTASIRKTFVSVSGKSHGIGSWRMPDIDDAVAEGAPGWVWSDPYTSCTYCPECWEQVKSGKDAA